MKAFLMHPDRDFDARHPTPPNDDVLTPDLELSTLLAAMAAGDKTLFDVASLALLVGLREPNEIVYRQRILADCLENSALVRELYELAGEAIKAEKSVWGSLYRDSPRHVLSTAVKKMEQLVVLPEVAARRSPTSTRCASAHRDSLGSSRCSWRSSMTSTSMSSTAI